MRHTTKMTALLLTSILAAVGLTGCGSQTESTESAFIPFQAETTAPTTPPTEAPTEIPTTLPPTDPPTEAPTTQAGLSIGIQIGKETAAPSGGYREAYREIVERFAAEGSDYHYDLIYVDEDDVPELLVSGMASDFLYMYDDGSVFELMAGWPWGAMGNNGYYYMPRANQIYNYNHDYAGLLGYASYMKIDANHEIVSDYYLELYHFNDLNENNQPDEGEYEAWVADGEHTIYYMNGTERISEEEALSYDPMGQKLTFLYAESTYDQIMAQLK